MIYRKYHIKTDDDLNVKRRKRKGANRIVVNRGWTSAFEGETPFITIQLQWYPLPSWAGVSQDGKVESVRLTLEETAELIDILKEQKEKHEKEVKE